jgi:hypothetical protein
MKETEVSWRRIVRFFVFTIPPAAIAAVLVSTVADGLTGTSRFVLYGVVIGGSQAFGSWLAKSRWGALVFGPKVAASDRPGPGARAE